MLRVVITGGTGFIGRKLAAELLAQGDAVTVLTRDAARGRSQVPAEVRVVEWTPTEKGPWYAEIAGADAIVHLAGESVARRWTEEARRAIVASRIDSTRRILEAIDGAPSKPLVLVSASAIGYYGAQPADRELDERSPRGEGFLAEVCGRWEETARSVAQYGVRAAQVRIGVVLGEGGGALEKMALPFKFFAGGPVGDGSQMVSWVHADDVVGIFRLALENVRVVGPINAVAPSPVPQRELAAAIGRALGRPSWLKAPAFAIHLALGEASEIMTTGQRVVPGRALDLGYAFRRPDLGPALASIFHRSP